MADLVKRGREKKQFGIGDCVSVPPGFFGEEYERVLKEADGSIERLLGRIVALETGGQLSIQWDIDSETSYHVPPTKVMLEPKDTPQQIAPSPSEPTQPIPLESRQESVISIEDFQPAEQSTSKDTANGSLPTRCIEEFTLFSEAGDHFQAELLSTNVGTLVHGSPLIAGEGKFLITCVLDQSWQHYDEDIHHANTFIKWSLSESREVGERKKEKRKKPKFNMKIRGKKMSERLAARKEEDSTTTDLSGEEAVEKIMNVGKRRRPTKKPSKNTRGKNNNKEEQEERKRPPTKRATKKTNKRGKKEEQEKEEEDDNQRISESEEEIESEETSESEVENGKGDKGKAGKEKDGDNVKTSGRKVGLR